MLLIGGKLYSIPGVTSLAPASHGGPAWARLDPGDYRTRRTRSPWQVSPWQVLLHTTKGIWPQHVIPGRGPDGRDRRVAEYWHRDPEHSAAHIVIDSDGSVVCLADLATTAAYHATLSNDVSVGIEIYQEADGGIYEEALTSAVATVLTICDVLMIPEQYVADPYRNTPLERIIDDPNFRGVLGHRHNTHRRGRGDPGDEIFDRLGAAGFEPVLVQARQDLERTRRRQAYLVAAGADISIDGVAGPRSIQAARDRGYRRWPDVPLA